MFEFIRTAKQYFDIQVLNTTKYVIPSSGNTLIFTPVQGFWRSAARVPAFESIHRRRLHRRRVELNEERVVNGRKWLGPELGIRQADLYRQRIYHVDVERDLGVNLTSSSQDVIEHIYDQAS